MIEDSLPVHLMVYEKFVRLLEISPQLSFSWDVFVKSGKVRWHTGVKPTDNFVEYCLFLANILLIWVSPWTSKAVFFIGHLPNRGTIIVRERFDICVKIKVLAFVVFFILYMPDPTHRLIIFVSLSFPGILIHSRWVLNLISLDPIRGNVFLVTSTNSATLWFTNFVSCVKLAFSVEVGSECSEVFCLY